MDMQREIVNIKDRLSKLEEPTTGCSTEPESTPELEPTQIKFNKIAWDEALRILEAPKSYLEEEIAKSWTALSTIARTKVMKKYLEEIKRECRWKFDYAIKAVVKEGI